MHVRAYNYWVSLLNGRDYPSIEDLEPGEVSDFADNSVLLDFTAGRDNPATPYIGAAIREECGLDDGIKSIERSPQPLAAVAADRPLSADHRQPRADRLRGRVREPARRADLLPRHPHAVLVGRRHDRFHLRRHQLETWRGRCGPPKMPPQAQVEAAPQSLSMSMTMSWFSKTSSCQPPQRRSADRRDSGRAERCVRRGRRQLHGRSPGRPLLMGRRPAPRPGVATSPRRKSRSRPMPASPTGLWAARETADAVKAADGRSRAALYRALSLRLTTSHWLPSGSRRIMPSCSKNRA